MHAPMFSFVKFFFWGACCFYIVEIEDNFSGLHVFLLTSSCSENDYGYKIQAAFRVCIYLVYYRRLCGIGSERDEWKGMHLL